MENKSGIEFLTKIYNNLHNEEIVKHASSPSDNKYQAIEKYMDRLERITERVYKNKKNIDLLKRLYYDKYVIKAENVPESYFEKNEKLALDRGYGYVKYTKELKQHEIDQIINEQKESLDSWLDYFASSDTKHYPTWFKYYCFQSVVKLGYFDKKSDKFTKRTDSTIKPFIEINRGALAFMYDLFVKALDKKELDDKDLEQLINNGSFAKIYSYAIKKIDSVEKDNTNSDDGIWKKYNQGSKPSILFNDIHGKSTGWCTAEGMETAKDHLKGGDFYVYYTKDKNGKYTVPRIAIRTEDGSIAEVRGVAENQNLEPNMEKVLDKKLDEFPDKEIYKKKLHDMEMLTLIYTKWKNSEDLTKEDLWFLYEIEDRIIGFGYSEDPRIEEILHKRNEIEDYCFIFDCKPEQISFTKEEALSGNIIFHRGGLNLSELKELKNKKLPQIIRGHLDLSNITNIEDSVLPRVVRGAMILTSLKSLKGVELPEKIGGDLVLYGLTSEKVIKLSKKIGGNIEMENLESCENLEFPEIVGRNIELGCLKTIKDCKFPNELNGYINLRSLEKAENVVFPEKINGFCNLRSLVYAKDLKLSKKTNGDLDLRSLKIAINVELPSDVGQFCLYLDSLQSGKGIVFPEVFNGSIVGYIASNMVFPKILNGTLNLSGEEKFSDVILPEQINGDLVLDDLKSDEVLVLPKIMNGYIFFYDSIEVKKVVLPHTIKKEIIFDEENNDERFTIPEKYDSIYTLDEIKTLSKKYRKKIDN